MALPDIAWRAILKRFTWLKNYLTPPEQDEEDVINNELLSWWLLWQTITPTSTNQDKQSNIVSLKPLTGQINSLVESYPGSSDIVWWIESQSTDLNVKTSEIEKAYWPRAPVSFKVPEIWTVDENKDFSTIKITQEELDALKKEEEAPQHESKTLLWAMWEDLSWATSKFFTWNYAWQQEAKILAYNTVADAANIYNFDEDFADEYRKDVSIAAQIKNWIDEWLYTQQQYDEAIEDIKDRYWDNTDSKFDSYLKSDISTYQTIARAQEKLNKIDPSIQAEQTAKNIQVNTATDISMEKVQQAVKYSNLWTNAQEFIKDSYNVFNDQYTRWVNALAPARRVKAQLQNYYWTDDTSKYSVEDRNIANSIAKAELLFNTFVTNYWNRVAQYPQFADKTTGKLLVPDIIDWVNLHDAIFKWTENILTDEDYWASWWFGEWKASAQDVLASMSANIATDYSIRHWSMANQWWTLLQHWLRPVWEIVNELWQQRPGRIANWIYNITSSAAMLWNWKNYWRISFDAVDQDATLISTLNTNNSATWRLIQKYMANTLEYTPEVIWNTINVFKLASLPSKIRNTARFRAFMNVWLWKPFQAAKATWKTTREVLDAIWKWERVAWLWLKNLNNTQRFWRFVASDAVPELVWDQVIDASLSVADTDFGSNTSMVFSVWGTVIWTLWVKMAEAWLFQMWRNWLNMIKDSIQNKTIKTNWMDWTVWNVLDTLKWEEIDALVKARYWLNSSQLATLEELRSFTSDFKIVSNTVKAAFNTLTDEQKSVITKATKWKIWDALQQLVKQVYWWDSQFARRIAQLIADDRTNPADVFKYALWVRGQVEIWWWKSRISLADSSDVYVHWYNERLDAIPWFTSTGFWRKLREWFSESDLKNLADSNIWWAKNWSKSWNFKKWNNWKYYFTKKWLDEAGDIRSSSLDVALISTATETADEFDTLMRNSNIKKISDKTLNDIRDSWAYDTLADALAELAWLCWLAF